MGVQLAMYKGKGQLGNSLIRWWTNSTYSHCELVVKGTCYSSSMQDKGVRRKEIDLYDGKWDVVDIPWADEELVLSFFQDTRKHNYGWMSLVFSQIFNGNIAYDKTAFCSQWCAKALGLPSSSIYSPATLFDLVQWLKTF